jgi:hypothetical protein
MKYYNSSRSPTPSIASIGAISVTSRACVCREKSTWDEQHSVFFAKNEKFFQNSVSHGEPFTRSGASSAPTLKDGASWVIEDGNLNLFGRVNLQIVTGHFRLGFLAIDLDDIATTANHQEVLGLLITSIFISKNLDTLKIVGASNCARLCIESLCPLPPIRILSFSTEFLPQAAFQAIHDLDRAVWMESETGKKSAASLGWLKNRLARSEAAAAVKRKKRRWLFRLLTLGRSRE